MKVSPDTNDPIYWAAVYRLTAVNFRLSAEALAPNLELRDDGSPAKITAIPFYFLVSHAIEHRHEHRGKRQVGVRGPVGNAVLQSLRMSTGRVHRDSHRGGPVPLTVRQVHGSLEPRNKSFVAIGRRVGDRAQGGGMAQ